MGKYREKMSSEAQVQAMAFLIFYESIQNLIETHNIVKVIKYKQIIFNETAFRQ